MMVMRGALAATLVSFCAGCMSPRAAVGPTTVPSDTPQDSSRFSAVVDDVRQVRRLQDEASALVAAGRTVKMATLIAQAHSKMFRVDMIPTQRRDIPSDELYERMRRGVLVIGTVYKCEKCGKWHAFTAGGFVISASGAAVTSYHLLNEPKRETLVAMTSDGRVVPVKAVLAASKVADVAILQLDGDGFEPLALERNAEVGSRVRVISHPDGRFFTLTQGIISRYFAMRSADGASVMMAITADYAKGSSGAPVFNDRGAVVGMVASTSSIYYTEKDGHGENLQMVIKQCVPAANVLKLIGP